MSPYEVILDNLNEIGELDYSNADTVEMFTNLIKLMGEEDFNSNFVMNFDYYENFDQFFFAYQKQFRQCDIFKMEGVETIGRSRYAEDKEYWDKRAEDKNGYIIQNGTYLHFPIGGHLDMLFWNMIHIGSKVWEKVLKHTYVKYKHENSKQKKTEEV